MLLSIRMKNKVAYYGMFIALAAIASYIEAILPFSIGIPGVKLGLANIIMVSLLYLFGISSAIMVSVARIFIVGFMFGNLSMIIYSLFGGLLSLFVMYMAKKLNRFSIIGVSILGGVSHNIGQAIAAFIIVGSAVVVYFPVLIIAGIITGLVIGIVTKYLIERLNKVIGGKNDFLR